MIDPIAFAFAVCGGVFMGSYPVPIKAPSVIAANVHPIVFQCFKTFWVFATGWLFVLANVWRGKEPVAGQLVPDFDFSWWGVVSAAAWIPSGIMTITSVPLLGVGMAIVVNAGTAAVLSFLVGWLVLDEELKTHAIGGGKAFYTAPIYLVTIVVGMVALVYAPSAPLHIIPGIKRYAPRRAAEGYEEELDSDFLSSTEDEESGSPPQAGGSGGGNGGGGGRGAGWQSGLDDSGSAKANNDISSPLHEVSADSTTPLTSLKASKAVKLPAVLSAAKRLQRMSAGIAAAMIAGVFSALQFGAVNLGKRYEEKHAGCFDDKSKCSAALIERFDNFGSWMTSFGIGAAMITSLFAGAFCIYTLITTRGSLPDFHFHILKVPGSIAGICWSLGAFFQTAAVVRGGNATMMPANLSIQIITSGAWGILYYKEMPSKAHGVLWCIAALWTLVSIVLLGEEKRG